MEAPQPCAAARASVDAGQPGGLRNQRSMNHRAPPSTAAKSPDGTRPSGVASFQAALRAKPIRTSLGLGVEYAMFASGASLALGLFATRVPLRLIDRALGLRLRERFIDLLAKASPG